ncbi:bifunctional 4-hydroxy-2-oxoglutarate aldolase/2-dehydro-3-deoxy-phosphogluconate aldolase [Arachnia propionica]|nr:bifunctional 4-hydroxy-2-oxoglutarate aldolase/2-dehydro-3-deoxy-phosphogluconate aldolase [Arachnia propionica]
MSDAPLTGLVVLVDPAPLSTLVGVVEVLVQEGAANISLSAEDGALEPMLGMYGARTRIGCHGPLPDVMAAMGMGAQFLLPDDLDEPSARAARERGVACYGMAMTPTEVRRALELPVDGVQLFPADVTGPLMADRLRSIGLIEHVIPRGGVVAYSAKQWLKAGAPAVCADSALLADALTGGDLAALRERYRNYVG